MEPTEIGIPVHLAFLIAKEKKGLSEVWEPDPFTALDIVVFNRKTDVYDGICRSQFACVSFSWQIYCPPQHTVVCIIKTYIN